MVDRDARGEGDTSLEILAFLASESFLNFLFDHGVDSSTNSRDIGARHTELSGLQEALCSTITKKAECELESI